jgi:hypothetical protein
MDQTHFNLASDKGKTNSRRSVSLPKNQKAVEVKRSDEESTKEKSK